MHFLFSMREPGSPSTYLSNIFLWFLYHIRHRLVNSGESVRKISTTICGIRRSYSTAMDMN
jgi:hypothetical protein